jgi:hypothetical protein
MLHLNITTQRPEARVFSSRLQRPGDGHCQWRRRPSNQAAQRFGCVVQLTFRRRAAAPVRMNSGGAIAVVYRD